MFKYFVIQFFTLIFLIYPQMAFGQVYLSDYAKTGMKQFENERPKFCFDYAIMLQNIYNFRDGKPLLESVYDVYDMDYEAESQNIESVEGYSNYFCNVQFVTFIESEVKNVCPLSQIPKNKFCKNFYELNKDSKAGLNNYFVESFEDFGSDEINFGWSVGADPEVLSGHYANAIVGLGNIKLMLQIILAEVNRDDPVVNFYKDKEYIYFELENAQDIEKTFIPLLLIIASPLGLADDNYLVSFEAQYQSSNGLERVELTPTKQLGWNELYYFDSPLTADVLDILLKAERLVFSGKYPQSETDETIFVMDMNNSNFKNTYNTLISQFSNYVTSRKDTP